MRKTLRTLILVVFISTTSFMACQPMLAIQTPCDFLLNSQQQRVSWRGNTPIVLHVSPYVPPALMQSIYIAANEWNSNTGLNLIVIDSTPTNSNTPQQDGVNGIYWITSGNQLNINEEGRTTYYWQDTSIFEADILINAQNYSFAPFGSSSSLSIDFTSLMVHEMGHVLGLQHITNAQSVMNPVLNVDTLRYMPYDIDIANVKCGYN